MGSFIKIYIYICIYKVLQGFSQSVPCPAAPAVHGASPPPAAMSRTRLQHAQLCTHRLGISVWPPGAEILQISDLPLHPTTCKRCHLCEEQEACPGAHCSGDVSLMSSLLPPPSALQEMFMVWGMFGVALHKKGQSNPSALSSRNFFSPLAAASLHAAVCVGGDAFQPKTERKKILEKQPVHRKHILGTANVSCTVPTTRSGRALLHHSGVGGQLFLQELMSTSRPAGENEDQPIRPHQPFSQL